MNSNTMMYRGYTAAIQYDAEDELFYGDVVDLRDTITFTGSSVEELKDSLRHAVDDYIVFCESQGKEPEKPFSGRILLRLEPSLHRQASVAATASQVSLNTLITRAIEHEVTAKGAVRNEFAHALVTLTNHKSLLLQAQFVGGQRARNVVEVETRSLLKGVPSPATSWTDVGNAPTVFERGTSSVAA